MTAPDETSSEPSVVSALGRAVEASQRLLMNRIDLARLDFLDAVARIERGGLLVAIGAVVMIVGWLSFTTAAVLLLQDYLSLPASAALAGVINALIGIALVSAGVRRTRPPRQRNGNGERKPG